MKMNPRIIGSIRRLSARGWSEASIASAYHLPRADVRAALHPTPPPRPRPSARPLPAPRPPRPAPSPPDPDRPIRGVLARQVRTRAAEGATPATIAAAAPTPEPLPPVMPRPIDWAALRGMREHGARGGLNPRAALSDDQARRLRTLRAQGWTRRELAEEFQVSMATVGRIVEGRSYLDAMPPSRAIEAPEPATAAPAPARWSGPASWSDD